ncbi:MAG: SDR family oxidoreductase [Burkholderiales bacterium]
MTPVATRVVITGASSGIGRALAVEYARQGATLCLIARRKDLVDELAASLPVRTYTYAADVRDAAALLNAARDFTEHAGCPDVVIANAGVSAGTSTGHPGDNVVFQEILATNLTGLMLTFQAFLPGMVSRRAGVLVGIASVAGFRGLPGAAAYSASKAAVISYLESLRVELRDNDISVTTICPGYIASPMTAKNPYPMPFLMKADVAATKMVRAIEQRKRFYVLPWQMAVVGCALRALPRPVFDYLFAHAPHKPRRNGRGV